MKIVQADSFRIHYSLRGSGRDVTVQAESSAEARQTVIGDVPWLPGDGARAAKICFTEPGAGMTCERRNHN